MDRSPEQAAKAQKPLASEWRTPAGAAVTVSLITVFLSFLGYGYALAVEAQFGIPESMVAESPLDYLRFSSHVLAYWVSAIPNVLTTEDLYRRMYADWLPWCLGLSVLWCIAVLFGWLEKLRHRAKAMVTSAVAYVRENPIWKSLSRWAIRWRWWALSLFSIWSWMPIGMWLLALAISMFGVLLTFVPLLGYATGLKSLQKWVIEPESCSAELNRERRLAPPIKRDKASVACVQVHMADDKGSGQLVQGRVAASTAKWTILFNPDDGAVWRVPVESAHIDLVSALRKHEPGISSPAKATLQSKPPEAATPVRSADMASAPTPPK